MASYLHHAVIAKAKKNGITLVSTGHGIFVATFSNGDKYEGEIKDATTWLDDVLKASKPSKPSKPTSRKTRDEDDDEDFVEETEDDEDVDDAADALEGNEDDEEEDGRSIVAGKYKAKYAENPGNLKGSCGDDMAAALKELTDFEGEMNLSELRRVCRENKIDFGKYERLKNNGQKRMVVGNILRGLLRKGTDVKIGMAIFRGVKQPK